MNYSKKPLPLGMGSVTVVDPKAMDDAAMVPFNGETPEHGYGNGKYQNQVGVTPAKV